MNQDPFSLDDPDKLALFVQEYIRREGQEDAGVVAVIYSQLRNPQYLPHQIAERLLATPEIQGAIKAVRAVYKPVAMKEISADSISADMEPLFESAIENRQYTAAIAAKKLQAELHGLLKKDINVNVTLSKTSMTDAQLEAIAKKEAIDVEFSEVTGGLPSVVNGR